MSSNLTLNPIIIFQFIFYNRVGESLSHNIGFSLMCSSCFFQYMLLIHLLIPFYLKIPLYAFTHTYGQLLIISDVGTSSVFFIPRRSKRCKSVVPGILQEHPHKFQMFSHWGSHKSYVQ